MLDLSYNYKPLGYHYLTSRGKACGGLVVLRTFKNYFSRLAQEIFCLECRRIISIKEVILNGGQEEVHNAEIKS